jgi:hypothetical protein
VDAAEALRQAQARKGFPFINKALMRENGRTIGIAGWHGASYHAGVIRMTPTTKQPTSKPSGAMNRKAPF